ncbi:MAG: hypothetical protein MJ229_02105 [bacterium]|nr:hypothetical protein [bacterium]
MKYSFLDTSTNSGNLFKQTGYDISHFLLENNRQQIEKLYNFYAEDKSLLYINGFFGTGKRQITKYSSSFLNSDVITLKYNCFNSTVLDDILLKFDKDLKTFATQGFVTEPKIKTDNFSQKVNSYFAHTEKPFLIVLESFEAVLDENRQEILDFILHLCSLEKIKVIIIGKTFTSKYFKDIDIERITTLAFSENIFADFIKTNKIKASKDEISNLYKFSRGYYLYTTLAINIIKTQDTDLKTFLEELRNSFIEFEVFLEKKALSIVPKKHVELFWFLVLIRHDVSIDLLKKIDLYDEETINLLHSCNILRKEDQNIYISSFFEDVINSAPQTLIQRIRQYLVEIYQAQLPLKPFERDFCISRQTMRKEIEFHKMFLPKKLNTTENNNPVDMEYLKYSKFFETQQKQTNPIEELLNKQQKDKEENKAKIDITQRKNISLDLSAFVNTPEKVTNTPKEEVFAQNEDTQPKTTHVSLKSYIEYIKKAEKAYEYSNLIDACYKALALKTEPQYQELLPFIYAKMAIGYEKTAQYEKSLSYYSLLENLYLTKNNLEKVSQIKYKTANIYYETYKQDKAKELYIEITQLKQTPNIVAIKSYLKLANIEEETTNSIHKLFDYYKQALVISKNITDENILSELYFKFALLLDEQGNIENAIEFYNRCIDLGKNIQNNKFLSSAYSNLASLNLETGDTENAISNFELAYAADKEANNFEGALDSASKLSNMLKRKDKKKALEYYNAAYEIAQKTNDTFYIVNASLELGDFYYENQRNELALKFYLNAYDMAVNSLTKDNVDKIKIRLNDIKIRLGETNYNSLISIIREELVRG